MDRRGFLRLGAGVLLPKAALDVLARNEAAPDIVFMLDAERDPNLQEYIRLAAEALCRAIDKDILDAIYRSCS